MNFSQIRPAIKITMLLTLILVSALAWAAEEKALGDKVAVVNGVTISKDMYDREDCNTSFFHSLLCELNQKSRFLLLFDVP